MRAVLRRYKDLPKGITVNFQIIRPLATVVNIEAAQRSSTKSKSLLDVYHKKKIVEEERQAKLGHENVKNFEERHEEEMKKTIIRYTETELRSGTWTENSRRAGVVGMKIGGSLLWRKDGRPVRVTLIQVYYYNNSAVIC